ncbi:hypothetical protein ACF06P_30660 [Streptomyces sp. NPDC015684]|uniref:hypothetical protein n=1 Tax=unclassified Streptomyces TaxID=2593676 RepID=UPI0037033A9B
MKPTATLLARLALVAALSAGASLVLPESAQAGTCSTQGCGGEVSNNARMNIRIANNWCWPVSDGWWYSGKDTLPCVSKPGTWSGWPADVELPPGDWSGNHSRYYDTDAVRFYRGCVTKWHYWGLSVQTTDRRGKSSLWLKLFDTDHVYIDSISC